MISNGTTRVTEGGGASEAGASVAGTSVRGASVAGKVVTGALVVSARCTQTLSVPCHRHPGIKMHAFLSGDTLHVLLVRGVAIVLMSVVRAVEVTVGHTPHNAGHAIWIVGPMSACEQAAALVGGRHISESSAPLQAASEGSSVADVVMVRRVVVGLFVTVVSVTADVLVVDGVVMLVGTMDTEVLVVGGVVVNVVTGASVVVVVLLTDVLVTVETDVLVVVVLTSTTEIVVLGSVATDVTAVVSTSVAGAVEVTV